MPKEFILDTYLIAARARLEVPIAQIELFHAERADLFLVIFVDELILMYPRHDCRRMCRRRGSVVDEKPVGRARRRGWRSIQNGGKHASQTQVTPTVRYAVWCLRIDGVRSRRPVSRETWDGVVRGS